MRKRGLNRGSNVCDEMMEDISFVQEALKRIHSHKGVRGSIIVSAEGVPLRSRTFQMNNTAIVQEILPHHRSA